MGAAWQRLLRLESTDGVDWGGAPYKVERRTTNKRGGGQLSGYALDITVRDNGDEAYFLQDHNSDRNVMPHNNRKEAR